MRGSQKQCGYVMLAVLWLVAALSLMVATLLHDVRHETRQAMAEKNKLIAKSQAEAAIRLVLCDLAGDLGALSKGIVRKTISIFNTSVSLEIAPMNGYVDLNNSPSALLADLLRYAGGLSADAAADIASRIVTYRNVRDPQGQLRKFQGIEDLLRVEGVDHDLYVKIEKLVTANRVDGKGLVNPLAAPEGVLVALAQGDVHRAHQLAVARRTTPETADTSNLTASQIESIATSYLEIRALGPVVDEMAYGVIWQVDIQTQAHGLPWRTISMKPYSVRVGTELF